MSHLLSPLRLGDLQLPNRILMSPLTRSRSGPTRVPNALNVEYYRQRAGAGLILTEATAVTPEGVGYADTPGHLVGRAGRGLEGCHPGRAWRRRPHLPAAVACGSHLASAVPERRIAGGAQRPSRRRDM